MFETHLGLLSRAFSCWHARMGRPITCGGETYRACLKCGARRLFDTETWRCYGPYFYEKSPGAIVHAAAGRRVTAHEATSLAPRHAG